MPSQPAGQQRLSTSDQPNPLDKSFFLCSVSRIAAPVCFSHRAADTAFIEVIDIGAIFFETRRDHVRSFPISPSHASDALNAQA
jgi:hypothetical protein